MSEKECIEDLKKTLSGLIIDLLGPIEVNSILNFSIDGLMNISHLLIQVLK